MHAKYSIGLRALHWLMAALIIAELALGLTMFDFPKELKPTAFFWHKSVGITLGMLLLLRVGVRLASVAPPLPASFPRYERVLAKAGHAALYALMLLFPLSGYLMGAAKGHDVPWFGLMLPALPDAYPVLARTARFLHEALPNAFIALIVLHAAAVAKHWFSQRENLLKRMF